jgi:hypothetical protein
MKEYKVTLNIPLVFYIKAKSEVDAFQRAEKEAQREVNEGVFAGDIDFERVEALVIDNK